ncbi:carbohydrate ABC transporter permease [Nakamurella flava]|uniref:Carbohydrate ABC transporter permease n=1 Tax=Nakamurella flava TaxID=2576308 RepID=A0A4U6QBL3_9ACTN|nr:carbohydrate ABC transporter permease [Nakamurella flava]TKV57302.1 carbohydrate ABC transporter permease [Nakamurella flava]
MTTITSTAPSGGGVRQNRPASHWPAKIALLAGLTVGALFAGLPVLWMLSNSFKSNTEIFSLPPSLITDSFSFSAYTSILTDSTKLRFFLNSYVIALSVTALTLLVSLLAAYAFSRYEFRGKKALSVLIVSVQAIPPITLLVPYFGLMVVLKLYNTYPGLILTYMVFTLPYAIIMMTGYFNTLPKELDEAVRVDGGGPLVALFRVLVPISIPGIISVSVYTFMISWNEFLFALTLTKTEDMRTVPVGIQLLMGQHSYEWNEMMAMSVLGSIPVLLLFLIFQRYFIGGMTSGSVKS